MVEKKKMTGTPYTCQLAIRRDERARDGRATAVAGISSSIRMYSTYLGYRHVMYMQKYSTKIQILCTALSTPPWLGSVMEIEILKPNKYAKQS